MTKEEAIKIASEMYGWLKTDREREALETLIPELREDESEDESKRKSLIKFLNDIKEISESGRTSWAVRKDDAEMCKSFLDYLEKEKEQNPIDIDFVSDWLRKHIKTYINSEYNEFHKAVEYDGSIDIEHLIEDLKKATGMNDCLEKQKEEDKCPEYCVRSHCIGCSIYEKQKEQKPADLPPGFYFIDLDGNRYYSKEFRYGDMKMKVVEKEQKPVEPSDEELQRHQDELYNFQVFAAKQAREYHISHVHDFEWYNFCAELLSYFNEKQKPAEWTEEDKTLYNNVLDGLKYAYEDLTNHNSYDTADCIRRAFDWMKDRYKKLVNN